MPTLTIAAALLRLTNLGIPWNYPAWQDATGVRHGLFPENPRHRPKGWTQDDVSNIKSFLSRYKALATEDKQNDFFSDQRGTVLPGRKKWKTWINSLWKSAGFYDKIISVFSSHNCHPYARFLAEPEVKIGSRRTWPSGGQWIPICLDDIAIALFGEECMDSFGYLSEVYRPATQALAQRTWNGLVRRIGTSLARLPGLELEARRALDGLYESNVNNTSVSTAINAVAKWRNAVKVLDTPEHIEKLEKMEAELKHLMEHLETEFTVTKKGKSVSKSMSSGEFSTSNDMLKSLATSEDIQGVIALYHEHFGTSANVDYDTPLLEVQPTSISFDQSINGSDVGMEYEADKSRQFLASSLGFVNELPLLFNKTRHSAGLTPWTAPQAFVVADPANPPCDIKGLNLHWHQLAGIHAIIRACFTSVPQQNRSTGVLIADEVGLGKTYQAAAVIAFLADAITKQKEGLRKAPLLDRQPYLAGQKDIPSLPHLILVPGTLTSQWFDELCILFQPSGVDLFVYPTTERDRAAFWDEDGAFYSSKQPASNKIVLAPHSALTKDFSSLYQPARTRARGKTKDLPWKMPPLLVEKARKNNGKTLFNHQYLTVVIDEAHNFRNHGPKHLAALAILNNAIIHLPLTATPLQTATKDLAAMGRLVGLPFFFTSEAYEEEKEDIRALRRARKSMQDNNDDTDNEEDLVKSLQVTIAQRIQNQVKGHILRRTTTSRNNLGEELVPLPPCESIYAYLDLTKRELDIITTKGQNLEETIGTANLSQKIITRGFYIEYRLSLMFAHADLNAPIPKFSSLAEWDMIKSTKLDIAAQLCQYFLTRDDLPLPEFTDGSILIPPISPINEGQKVSTTCKIVVFTEFPSMLSLFINVFNLYNVNVLSVNGSMTFDKRAAIIKKFRESSEYRVLALSSVGTTGINLSFCSIVIFLDQPWSAQDIRQMTGRVHRQPQQKKVTCIHLLAKETSDIIVDGMARGKRDMMEAFLSKEAGKGLFQLLNGSGELGEVVSDEEDAPATRRNQKSSKQTVAKKTQPSKNKGKANLVDGEAAQVHETNNAEAVAIPDKHQKRRKTKPKPVIEDSDVDSTVPQKISNHSTSQPAPYTKVKHHACRTRMEPSSNSESDSDTAQQRHAFNGKSKSPSRAPNFNSTVKGKVHTLEPSTQVEKNKYKGVGETYENWGHGLESDSEHQESNQRNNGMDQEFPAQTETFLSNVFINPPSHASHIEMDEGAENSDSSMQSISYGAMDNRNQHRKRTALQMSSPPSPPSNRGPRPRTSAAFNDRNMHLMESDQDAVSQQKTNASKRRPENAVAGPSSWPTSLVAHVEGLAPMNSAAAPRPDQRISSSHLTTPAHRLPTFFHQVDPPEPLPPKKIRNPFEHKSKTNKRQD